MAERSPCAACKGKREGAREYSLYGAFLCGNCMADWLGARYADRLGEATAARIERAAKDAALNPPT